MKRCESKISKKACRICYQHRALFRYRGCVKWDREHDLCMRCYRSIRDRNRTIDLAHGYSVLPLADSGSVRIPAIALFLGLDNDAALSISFGPVADLVARPSDLREVSYEAN